MTMESLGGSLSAGRPIVVTTGTSTQVFAIDGQGVMNRWSSMGAAWSGPTPLPTPGTSLPASFPCGVALPDGSVQIFAIGADKRLQRWRSADGWRSSANEPVLPAGGNGLAAVSTPDGRIHVFAIEANGILEYTFDANASAMPPGVVLPGSAGLHPTVLAAVSAGGKIDVFAVGTSQAGVADGCPLHWHFAAGTWSRRFLPGPVVRVGPSGGTGFAAIAPAVDRVELFAITLDGRMTHWSFGLQATTVPPPSIAVSDFTWEQLPAGSWPLTDGVPAVATTTAGDLEVFAIGAGGPLVRWRAESGGWRAFGTVANLALGGVGAVPGAAFAFGTDNTLRHWPAGVAASTHEPWANWAANQSVEQLAGHCAPTCLEEVVAIVKTARQKQLRVRAVGSSWSLSDVAAPPVDGYVVETHALDRILDEVVPGALRSTLVSAMPGAATIAPRNLLHVEAGMQLEKLMGILDGVGLAPFTMGGASGQTLAGVMSTSVHGSDFRLPPFPDAVRAIHLVGPDGRQHWIEPSDTRITEPGKLAAILGPDVTLTYDDEWFDTVLVSVGTLGILYSVVLEVTDQYHLEEKCEKLAWLDAPGVPGLRSQLADGSAFSAIVRAILPDGTIVDAPRRCLQVAIDTTMPLPAAGTPNTGPTCYLTTRIQQTRAQAEAAVGGTPLPGGGGPDFLAAFCECHMFPGLFSVGAAAGPVLGATFGAAVLTTVTTLSATMPVLVPVLALIAPLAPLAISAATFFPPVLLAALKAGPPGAVGDFLSGVINTAPELAPEVIRFFTQAALVIGQPDGTLGGSPTRRDIAHQIMAPWNKGECAARAHALEIAFDTTNGAHLVFLDRAFVFLEAEARKGNILGGWFAIRFVGRSRAILSAQRSEMTCMVETVGLRALSTTDPLLKELEQIGRRSGGIQHWGMFFDLLSTDVDGAYPRLDTWLRIRQELTQGGTDHTFDSAFAEKSGLTAAPNPPKTRFANGTLIPDPYAFGTLDLHERRAVTFSFPNTGGRRLEILGMSADGDFHSNGNLELRVVTASATNGYPIEVEAAFVADRAGSFAGTLTIRTNASEPAGGVIAIPITAEVAALDARLVQPSPNEVLDLGSVEVGATGSSSFTVHNAGTMTAMLDGYTVSPPSAATWFAVETGAVAAGQTRVFGFGSTPTEAGPLTADLTLHFGTGTSPSRYRQDVMLKVTGVGLGARAELTPATVEFGTLALGAPGVPSPVLLRNVGQRTLTISDWSLPYEFRFVGTPPTSIAPGQSEELNVVFRPKEDGEVVGELSIRSNSTPPPSPVVMHGFGVTASLLAATPDGVSFGPVAVPVGAQSGTRVVTVQNQGATVVQLGAVSIVGAAAADFRILGTTATTDLPHEGTFEVRIVFVPESGGPKEAALEIVHDGPTSPLRIWLTGQASRPRGLVPTVVELDFGQHPIGSSDKREVAVTNADRRAIRVENLAIGGVAAADFAIVSDGCSGSDLAPGASCTIMLSTTPTERGGRDANLEVNGASAVSLHVEGLARGLSWRPATFDFGPVPVGAVSMRQQIDLHNDGDTVITVSGIELIGDFTVEQLTPTFLTIAPNNDMSFWVWFRPTLAGTRQSWLRVRSDAPGGEHLLELTGFAVGAAPKPVREPFIRRGPT